MMEMVISLAIIAVVFAAILPQFRNIQNSWASRQGTLETLQNGRIIADFLTRNLATAKKITAVSDSATKNGFIEFEDENGDTFRFSLSKQNYVRFGEVGKLFDVGGPVEQLQFTCYALDDLDTPITDIDLISYVKVQTTVINPSSAAKNQTFTASAIIYPSVELITPLIYWADGGKNEIYRASLDGSNQEKVVTGVHSPVEIELDFDGEKVYWANTQTHKIKRAGLDGSKKENVISNIKKAMTIRLDLGSGKIYWVEIQNKTIGRADLDGSNEEVLVSGIDEPMYPKNLKLDPSVGKMYWAEGHEDTTGKICRADLDGSNVEDLVTGLGQITCMAIDVDGAKVYWADEKNKKIQRSNLDGSSVWLVSNVDFVTTMELDTVNGKIYWADDVNNKIQRANLDGTMLQTLVIGVNKPTDLALDLDSGKLYWADDKSNVIRRSDLNGTNVETIVSGLDEPFVIALGGVDDGM